MSKPKIIIDSYIPYIQGVLDNVADVEYLSYKQMNSEAVRNADALIVRTRTHCNENLLKESKVKFIASATIGYDHIDAEYCKQHQIQWTNAPGCNSRSVAQYMASALSLLSEKNSIDLSTQTIGIVGVGAVGSKVADLCRSFGMKVLLNDPPRARKEGDENFVSLHDICRQADIITFHVPLNTSAEDTTFHLADEKFFRSLKKKPVIINAARGEIINSAAMLKAFEEGTISEMILDCWENEPDINKELLYRSFISTPHIAGYSADGKANAASHSVRVVSRFFNLGLDDWEVSDLPVPHEVDFKITHDIRQFFLETYDIEADSLRLKFSPETFEHQRSNYPFRREPIAYLDFMTKEFREDFITIFPVFI